MVVVAIKYAHQRAYPIVVFKRKVNIPEEDDKSERAGKVMQVLAPKLNNIETPYTHPKCFFSAPTTRAMVFRSPNKSLTTPSSKNSRSELRAMLTTSAKDPKNNFVVAAHSDAQNYGAIGAHRINSCSKE